MSEIHETYVTCGRCNHAADVHWRGECLICKVNCNNLWIKKPKGGDPCPPSYF